MQLFWWHFAKKLNVLRTQRRQKNCKKHTYKYT